MSRYNFPLYRDTVLGSSPNQFLHFFFRFLILFFSLLHFCYWNHPKNTYPYFFFPSFSNSPNKFVKINFHSFFFSFTPCKTLENNFLHLNFFFHFPITQINLLKFILFIVFFSSFTHYKTPKLFQHFYVLIIKHTNNHNT